jgi:hypothetical protein
MDATPQAASAVADNISVSVKGQRPDAGATAQRPRFFLIMSAICLAIAVVGFVPSFFAPLVTGQFSRPPVFYVHALFFFAWVGFFFAQNWQIAKGRVLAHREWGVVGAGLVVGMFFSVLILVIFRLHQNVPMPVPPTILAWNGAAQMTSFGILVAAGLANVRRPEVHKRFMLVATMSILGAPIARWPESIMNHYGLSPIPAVLPTILVSMIALFGAAMIYDRRTYGRISRIYIFGFLANLALGLTAPLIANNAVWLSITNWMKIVAG